MGVLGEEALDRIAAQPTSADAGKDWAIGQTVAFAQPSFEGLSCFRAEWGATLFSAFPEAAHVGARSQHDILTVEPDQLGNSQTGLDTHEKKGAIPTSQPGGKVGNREQGIDLFPVEKFDGPPYVALIGNRQDPLAMERMGGLLQGNELEERMDSCEARIPRARAVFAGAFQVVEEKTDKGRVKIFDAKLGGHFAESFFRKVQKQAEAIAISRDRMRTRLPLAKQAIGKEGLKKGGKVSRDHGRTSRFISRSVASWRSSGTASRYQ